MNRVERKTKETDITVKLLERPEMTSIDTGIGFLDHMLMSFSKHAECPLFIKCQGDTYVDSHHTAEDVGLVLGQCLKKKLKATKNIQRFGHILLPMDDALVLCAMDLSGRTYLDYQVTFTKDTLGQLDTECIEAFFYSIARSLQCNLHLKKMSGYNNHHLAEGLFKAFAYTFKQASRPSCQTISTKGGLYDSYC